MVRFKVVATYYASMVRYSITFRGSITSNFLYEAMCMEESVQVMTLLSARVTPFREMSACIIQV